MNADSMNSHCTICRHFVGIIESAQIISYACLMDGAGHGSD